MKSFLNLNILIFSIYVLVILSGIPYHLMLSNYINVLFFIIFQLFIVSLCFLFLYKRMLKPYSDFFNSLRSYIGDNYVFDDYSVFVDMKKSPDYILQKAIQYKKEQEEKQQQLLEQLKSSNTMLERSSKITDSIIKITSEILSSGEIDETLQVILDKAIEIIPNAQKGSILIYDGEVLRFRAVKGYDYNVYKDVSLKINELLQFNSTDFYQPCIVSNPESYNRDHMESKNYKIFKESKGFEMKSILSCAIVVDGNFYGIINLDNLEDPNAFTENDKPIIKHLSAQIGIALKNTLLIERILYLSRHDSLTAIYNRGYFEELLSKAYHQCKSDDSELTFVMFDLNNLKQTNDTYGHEAGDLMLKKFVKTVQGNISPDDTFARLGGDEFAAFFINKNKNEVERIIDKIKNDLDNNPFTYCGNVVGAISFGYGIATYPQDSLELDELLKIADREMYSDKKRAKNLYD